ncbi:hypothetical protein FGG90_07335 [Clavibacter tessellarius]|uniref:hypothetical protein n=1 Tax=Clavibacter tessellarius TaxID=31965 RepID=UPI001055997F|nr:hypothetical protein [Clavibacter michiganensis]UKF33832.1 hypothetical protein FGG90_07335 [Clavibacter michiganensis subsp. tessellarius]
MSKRPNVADHPWLVNALGLTVVALHGLATLATWVPNVWGDFLAADPSDQAGVYLGFLGTAAIVSGLAGVVVIFGLTATGDKFRRFRIGGGKSLARNWTSTTSSGLYAAGLSLVASIFAYTPVLYVAPWLLEAAVLLALHASVRLLWLLRAMVGIVRADDAVQLREQKKTPLSAAPWKQTRS